MLRGLLIGVGKVALDGHLAAYTQDPVLSNQVEIVAAVDGCAENLAAFLSRLPHARGYATVQEAFGREEVDFVDICTPPNARLDLIRTAANRGVHILCEKPVATTLSEAQDIRRTIGQRPILFMPCHQYPFSPLWQAVLDSVRQSAIGEVRLGSIESYRQNADPGSLHWRAGWRESVEIAGGGILLDVGTHYLHLAHLLFGAPLSVSARIAHLGSGGREAKDKAEDTALVVLEYSDKLIELCLSWAAPRRENRLQLLGAGGSIHSDGVNLRMDSAAGESLWIFPDAMNKTAYPAWYATLFREFAGAILAQRFSSRHLDEAIHVARVTEAAYASARSNHTVMLAEFDAAN